MGAVVGAGASVDGSVAACVVVSAADAAEDLSLSDLDWHPASGVDNRSAQNRAMAARAVFFIRILSFPHPRAAFSRVRACRLCVSYILPRSPS